jgi:hypothetical protein
MLNKSQCTSHTSSHLILRTTHLGSYFLSPHISDETVESEWFRGGFSVWPMHFAPIPFGMAPCLI